MKDIKPCDVHNDCFANKDGCCTVLKDTDFGKKDCPFYKTSEAVRDSRNRSYLRLIDLDRTDLIENYGVRAYYEGQ